MQAEVHILHQSDFYQIRDFRCTCTECSLSALEQCKYFSICFVRSGFYEQRTFRKEQEMHIGRLLVSKPQIEYKIRHINNHPDFCTSFNFTDAFYEAINDYYKNDAGWFLSNPDIQSLLLVSGAEIEFLHQRVLARVKGGASLEVDDLVVQLVDQVMSAMTNAHPVAPLSETLKKYHLITVERARDFLFRHFDQDLTLQQLAEHCCVSLFHFSRIFKGVMNQSPYQYLTALRLNHAKLLLQTTGQPVTQIAFQSGFNSLEHFTTMYKQQFSATPRGSKISTHSAKLAEPRSKSIGSRS